MFLILKLIELGVRFTPIVFRKSLEILSICGIICKNNEKMSINLAIIFGLILSPLAALMAFLITFEEYKHHYPDNSVPLKTALEVAVVTFLFFFIVSILIGSILVRTNFFAINFLHNVKDFPL